VHNYRLSLLAARAVTAIALSLSCSNPLGTSREIALPIADIQAPAAILPAGPLDIIVVVQTGGCVTFRRLDSARGGSVVTVSAIGHDASGPRINCPTDVRQEPKALRISGTFADSVVINGRQPDGSVLRRRVSVAG